jgi:hypothetical protein
MIAIRKDTHHAMPRCAAHNRKGGPCGRFPAKGKRVCYYHGGAPGSGAQPGNQNARTHGLYARNPHLTPEEHAALAIAATVPLADVLADHIALISVLVNRVLGLPSLDEHARTEVVTRALERLGRLVKAHRLISAPSVAQPEDPLDAETDALGRQYGRNL